MALPEDTLAIKAEPRSEYVSTEEPTTAIPVITEQDLIAFHATHFSHLARPATLFVDPATVIHLLPQAHDTTTAEEEEVEDELGYYPDGVKRTLTDDQIAMFRHSEKMQLDRQHKVNLEIDSHSTPSFDAHVALKAAYTAQLGQGQTQEHQSITNDKHDTASDSGSSMSKRQRMKEVPYAERHKRKWESYIESEDSKHGSITHRRLARELDEQQASSVDLDY